MDINAIAGLSTSIAETGNRDEVRFAVLKRALDAQSATATQLLDALPPVQTVQNLPSHLGTKINTTA